MNATLAAILAQVAQAAWRWARTWMKRDARPRGEWHGRYRVHPATPEEAYSTGYTAPEKCVRVTLDARSPLRFRHESGVEWSFKSGEISDGGSIPSWFQGSHADWFKLVPIGSDEEKAFFLHDAAYHAGALWMRVRANQPWQQVPVTRAVADLLLYQGLTATSASNATCSAIYAAVRSPFGAASWRRAQARIRAKNKANNDPRP